jgi:superfamily II DNA or RNA helicase
MKLFDYQQEVYDKAKKILDEHGFVILTLDTRLGKSPISLSLAEGKTLFVTTKGAIPDVKKTAGAIGVDCTVINYDSCHKCIDQYDTIIFDEHHSISSYPRPSLRIKKLRDMPKAKRYIYLSATPAVESHSQWFHPLQLCPTHQFSVYKNFYKWFKDWGIPALKFIGYGKQAND